MTNKLVTWLTLTVAALTGAIAIGAFTLSYDALFNIGLAYGVKASIAWLWPLLIDLPLIVFTLAMLVAQLTRQSVKLWAGLVMLYTLATIAFNLAHAQQTALGWLVAIVAPVGLLLSTEALRHLARGTIERQAAAVTLQELTQQAAHKAQELQTLTGQLSAKQSQLTAIQEQLNSAKSSKTTDFVEAMTSGKQQAVSARRERVLQLHHEGLSNKAIADTLGRDVRTIRNDIKALNGQVAQ